MSVFYSLLLLYINGFVCVFTYILDLKYVEILTVYYI